ncbi:hypothetical protein O181_022376 [Austropuccinia psidii MF-1]|uniref:Reverse transcriptase Ty1/copia-type domain-containing protein n=1 Tax=Austropuccinia psidii MF-1 TaxID=1389203 RepID=A0A9Q3CHB7_9BASI|nr:hypothetical protein [Austropuccinia psidii MF-1]
MRVDNIAIFGTNLEVFKREISKEFKIKHIGPADVLIGVKIHQMKAGISLDQQNFTKAPLEKYAMNTCKMVVTPLTPNEHFFPATTDGVISLKKAQNKLQKHNWKHQLP